MTNSSTAESNMASLRLDVAPVSEDGGGGFQVLVYVDGVETTAAGAGLGMDPYDVLVPINRHIATSEPHTTPIARCGCGKYGCGSTDVRITREQGVVRWTWQLEAPMTGDVLFPADAYDQEVIRAAEDHGWETSKRTAGRLVLTHADRDRLAAFGLMLSSVGTSFIRPDAFLVVLQLADDYQIFVTTPWRGRRPGALADEVSALLAQPPQLWAAQWHAIKRSTTSRPKIGWPSWRLLKHLWGSG